MNFGALPITEVDQMSFKLPADPAGNAVVLKKSKGKIPEIYIGCAKWGRPEWRGKIYPTDAKEKDFLQHYGQHYNSIELNATHYKIYDEEKLTEWMAKVNNPQFKFCPKAHRGMSFLKDAATKNEPTKEFINNIRAFGKQLGPIFITHDERVKWDQQSEKDFFDYLESLPRDISFFVEERWPNFYADQKLQERYYARLTELGIGTVITDTAGRQDVLHMRLTIPKTFIRFVGNSLHPSDYPRINHWATRLKKWMDNGIEEIYFFMHMHDEGKSPELTQYVVRQFNSVCKLTIPEVNFVTPLQGRLL
jgi:uncharacterized protein YecE (DUF72 family)